MRKEFQRAYHALLKGVVTIKVKFEAGGRLYTYRALERDNLQPGDTVVIQYRGKFFTTEVIEVDQYPDFSKDVEYKWIVCKVDAERYEQFLDQEAMFEQQLQALSAKVETDKVKNELVEQFGAENVGYLAAIAQGKVQMATLEDVLTLLHGQTFIEPSVIMNGSVSSDNLAEAMRKAAEQGAQHGFKMSMEGPDPRVDWESRYNKHIASMTTMHDMTWRDFMALDASTEDLKAVKEAKILFDRYKRKQLPIEKFINGEFNK